MKGAVAGHRARGVERQRGGVRSHWQSARCAPGPQRRLRLRLLGHDRFRGPGHIEEEHAVLLMKQWVTSRPAGTAAEPAGLEVVVVAAAVLHADLLDARPPPGVQEIRMQYG